MHPCPENNKQKWAFIFYSLFFRFCSPAKTPSSAPQVDIMAKFRRPAGSWECDVCMVQNTAEHTKCLACESPRPGTQSTGERLVSPVGGCQHGGCWRWPQDKPHVWQNLETQSTMHEFGGEGLLFSNPGSGSVVCSWGWRRPQNKPHVWLGLDTQSIMHEWGQGYHSVILGVGVWCVHGAGDGHRTPSVQMRPGTQSNVGE